MIDEKVAGHEAGSPPRIMKLLSDQRSGVVSTRASHDRFLSLAGEVYFLLLVSPASEIETCETPGDTTINS